MGYNLSTGVMLFEDQDIEGIQAVVKEHEKLPEVITEN